MDLEKRKELWEAAKKNGWSASSAAADMGPNVKAKSFQAVITGGYQGGKLAPAVDEWLTRNADRKAIGGGPKKHEIPADQILGYKLIALGGTLNSPLFDSNYKIKALRRFLEEFVSDFPVYISALEKKENPDS